MPVLGTKKDGNHPHPSLPRRGGGNNAGVSRRLDGKRGRNEGKGYFHINPTDGRGQYHRTDPREDSDNITIGVQC